VKLHPLLERNVSTLRESKFSTRLTGNEFFMKDHVIFGQKVLPGSAYLEMARAAGEIAGERKVFKLKNVFFATPVSLAHDAGPVDISIILNANEDQLEFEVTGSAVHAQGAVVFGNGEPATEFIDLQSILDRSSQSLDGEECYALFDGRGISYGETFRAIRQLRYNEKEGLARLELPPTAGHSFSDFVLHPSLLDAAFQTILTFRDDAQPDTAYLPVAVGEIQIVDDLPESCYAHIVRNNETRRSQSSLKAFNILIADDTGRVRLKIMDFAVKAFRLTVSEDEVEDSEPHDTADILNILQEIENGRLKVDAAEKFLDEIYA